MEMDTTDLIARARAGDHDAFRDLVEVHSHELQVHCYRILGSLQDAEDALQETLVSAWRNLADFGQRSSLRTWLYQIATNRCLSMLRADSRRPRSATPLPDLTLPEPTGVSDVPPWLEPYPDVLLDNLVDQAPGPEARYETTEAISLAFITALQLLPPRQRAVLVLRDVLGLPRERGSQDARRHPRIGSKRPQTSPGHGRQLPGGLRQQQARAPTRHHGRTPPRSPADRRPRTSRRTGPGGLLAKDVRVSMPPAMLEYQGIDVARQFFAAVILRPGRSYRVVPTRANGQPALGMYVADPHTGVYRAYGLHVVTIAGDRITSFTGFEASVLPRFGLPRTLPGTD